MILTNFDYVACIYSIIYVIAHSKCIKREEKVELEKEDRVFTGQKR